MKKKDKNSRKVSLNLFDTYIKVIKNSVGTKMFRNNYAEVDGEYTDITKDGDLSCAFYLSSVLLMFKLIKSVHSTVVSTVVDMKENGWTETKKPTSGDVVVWGEEKDKNHKHIGFFLDIGEAVSNSKNKRCPIKHSVNMKKRDVEVFLTNEKLKEK